MPPDTRLLSEIRTPTDVALIRPLFTIPAVTVPGPGVYELVPDV